MKYDQDQCGYFFIPLFYCLIYRLLLIFQGWSINLHSLSFLGNYVLAFALPTTLLSILFYLAGNHWKKSALVITAQRSTLFTFALLTLAVLFLISAFITNDFSILYVSHYSSRSLPFFFKVTGLWAGLDGSILFWVWLVSLYSVIVLLRNRIKNADWMPYINAVMMTIVLFFLSMILFANNPFVLSAEIPQDGRGLNPLLQNLAMVIHPPSLYLGFTGFSVPFAFAIAALITRRLDAVWIEDARRWTLTAWFFLTMGNILGAAWAYVELGWGGFWAWDPVENASLIPWLTASAYIHSVLIQKKRGMLAVWNVSLVCLTFVLTIFGTFLTRSGVVESVHAFSGSTLGPYFLFFIVVIIVVSTWLIVTRLPQLKSANTLQSYFSKESAFVLNNIILVVGAFCVAWGTLFPSLSDWIMGERITVGPAFFNKMMAPIGLILIFLMGFGPMVAWKKGSFTNLKTNLLWPLVVGLLSGLVFYPLSGGYWYVVLSALFIGFVLGTITLEFYRGISVVKQQKGLPLMLAFADLFRHNNRRYGGYLVHVGILMIFVAIAGGFFKNEADFSLNPGETFTMGQYRYTYREPSVVTTEHKTEFMALVDVFEGDKKLISLTPTRFFYQASQQPTTEAAIFHAPFRDIYLIVGNLNEQTERADFRVTINPLISFLWLGGIVILMASALVIIPRGSQKKFFKGGGKTLVLFLTLFLLQGGFSFVRASDEGTQRQQMITEKLRCMCPDCVRTSLRTCICDYAKKERQKILGMLGRGDGDAAIVNAFVDQYGLKVLMVPPQKGFFRIGFLLPSLVLIMAFAGGFWLIFQWRQSRKGADSVVKVSVPDQNDPYLQRFREEMKHLDD